MPPRPAAPAPGLTQAIIYTRVSSAEQAREGISLDVQLAECRRYAAAFGWVLAGEHQDVLSGTRDDRPAYRALLAECRTRRAAGEAVAVVVLRLDRLGRKLLERVRARDELKALGVPVHSVREGGEVSDLVSNILASVAQEEVRQLGERVSEAKQHLTQQGWWSGGRPPWGYRLRPATPAERAAGAPRQVLALDPTTAPFATEALTRFLAGVSVHAVVRWLATLPPAARGGRQLGYARVRGWLSAAAPRGYLGGQPGRWPPLIDAAQAAAIDARIAGWHGGRRQPSGRYLLTGLLQCSRCGHAMVGHAGFRRRAARYTCNRWRANVRPSQACSFGAAVADVDAAVLAAVGARLAPWARTGAAARALTRRWQRLAAPDAASAGRAPQQALERTQAQAQRRLRDAATLFVDGALDRAGYEAVRAEAEAALAAATAALARLPPVRPAQLPALAALRALAQSWGTLTAAGDPQALRALLLEVVATARPVRLGRRRITVEIDWTPLGALLERMDDAE